MEIKLELDTEQALMATVTITAAYGLCRISANSKYPQIVVANATALIVIIAILYGLRPAPKITKFT